MNKQYNILWIDDEHDDNDLIPFVVQAEQQNIILNGYSNFKEGFQALTEKITHYDAILLDALFLEDETSETIGNKGLGASIAKINELKSIKTFPHFVLSGQSSFTDIENDILEANGLRC